MRTSFFPIASPTFAGKGGLRKNLLACALTVTALTVTAPGLAAAQKQQPRQDTVEIRQSTVLTDEDIAAQLENLGDLISASNPNELTLEQLQEMKKASLQLISITQQVIEQQQNQTEETKALQAQLQKIESDLKNANSYTILAIVFLSLSALGGIFTSMRVSAVEDEVTRLKKKQL